MGELLIAVCVDEGDCGRLARRERARAEQGREDRERAGAAGERKSCGGPGTVHDVGRRSPLRRHRRLPSRSRARRTPPSWSRPGWRRRPSRRWWLRSARSWRRRAAAHPRAQRRCRPQGSGPGVPRSAPRGSALGRRRCGLRRRGGRRAARPRTTRRPRRRAAGRRPWCCQASWRPRQLRPRRRRAARQRRSGRPPACASQVSAGSLLAVAAPPVPVASCVRPVVRRTPWWRAAGRSHLPRGQRRSTTAHRRRARAAARRHTSARRRTPRARRRSGRHRDRREGLEAGFAGTRRPAVRPARSRPRARAERRAKRPPAATAIATSSVAATVALTSSTEVCPRRSTSCPSSGPPTPSAIA